MTTTTNTTSLFTSIVSAGLVLNAWYTAKAIQASYDDASPSALQRLLKRKKNAGKTREICMDDAEFALSAGKGTKPQVYCIDEAMLEELDSLEAKRAYRSGGEPKSLLKEIGFTTESRHFFNGKEFQSRKSATQAGGIAARYCYQVEEESNRPQR